MARRNIGSESSRVTSSVRMTSMRIPTSMPRCSLQGRPKPQCPSSPCLLIAGARMNDANRGTLTCSIRRTNANSPRHQRRLRSKGLHPNRLIKLLLAKQAGRQVPYFPRGRTEIGSYFLREIARRLDLAGIATRWDTCKGIAQDQKGRKPPQFMGGIVEPPG